MAKEISEIRAHLTPDETGKVFSKLVLQYKVSDSVNTDLFDWKETVIPMSGASLTSLQSIFTDLISEAETLEGIS